MQDVDGRAGVVERAVVGRRRRPEDDGQRRELVVARLVLHDQLPGQVDRVEHPEPRPRMPGGPRRLFEERHVEPGVVRDEHAVAGELEERGQDRLDPRRLRDHRVGDAGEHLDEHGDRLARTHQGLELAQHLAAADLDGPDLGDRRRGRAAAGGLQVDDDERHVVQWRAEVVQGALDRPGSRAGAATAAHTADGNRALRQPRAGARRVSGDPSVSVGCRWSVLAFLSSGRPDETTRDITQRQS